MQLLRENGIEALADIRTIPRSRANPQFNADTLGDALGERQLAYTRIAKLGGLRGRSKSINPSPNGFWTNTSFRNYADYALSSDFADGLEELEGLGTSRRTAFMCAEVLWWRCHRRIVTDYLLLRGHPVMHIMGPHKTEPAKMTEGARKKDGKLIYPAQ